MAKSAAAAARSKAKALKIHLHDASHLSCKEYLLKLKTVTTTKRTNNHSMSTRSATTAAVRDTVLNTTELLENILLHLPEVGILKARGVNKNWHAVIMTSPEIQQKLFLRAEPIKTVWEWENGDMELKEKTFDQIQNNGKYQYWTIPAKLNPMLFEGQPGYERGNLNGRILDCELIHFKEAMPSLSKQKSIYHGMFLTQPPTKQVEVELWYSKKNPNTSQKFRQCKVRNPEPVEENGGVTFGYLLSKCKNALGNETYIRDCVIKLYGKTVLYMGGVVFPTEAEVAVVKRNG